jgi:hypothetical protein
MIVSDLLNASLNILQTTHKEGDAWCRELHKSSGTVKIGAFLNQLIHYLFLQFTSILRSMKQVNCKEKYFTFTHIFPQVRHTLRWCGNIIKSINTSIVDEMWPGKATALTRIKKHNHSTVLGARSYGWF